MGCPHFRYVPIGSNRAIDSVNAICWKMELMLVDGCELEMQVLVDPEDV